MLSLYHQLKISKLHLDDPSIRRSFKEGGVSSMSLPASIKAPSTTKCYLGFDQDTTGNDYFLGVSICNNTGIVYHREFDQVQEHRAQWDPGGRRLGVKPSFKEGG